MDYAAAVAHLYALGQELAPPTDPSAPRRKFDLATMRVLMRALGDPQNLVPSVLIAGTNGKGSTASTLASILTAAGYRTGLYTSPHLIRVNERIQLAQPTLPGEYGSASAVGSEGELKLHPIPDDDFGRIYSRVWSTAETLVRDGQLPHTPSFFEVVTALAYTWFADRQADIMVLEVGLGGRLDATNIVEPLLSIITDIALDHQDYLGDTIALITAEKCGILRQNGTLITLPQHPEANQAIGEAAMALNVHGVSAAAYIPPPSRDGSLPETTDLLPRNLYTLRLEDGSGTILVDSPLAGQHQQRNIALALSAALELRNKNSYKITNTALEQGIHNTSWPGRLERIGENLLLDVAHNPAGAWTLRAAIAALPEDRPRTLLFSCLKDKNLKEISRILFPLFDSSPDGDPLRRHDHIVLAPVPSPRAASVDDLLGAAHALGIPAHAAPHPEAALAQARQITPEGGLIIATGSIFLVGELRGLLLHPHTEPVEVAAE
ncbi:bifunctional folylpolyglutamate synthase/dihydrofolate synthase [Granulicella sp. WH15]|uniref:bifunctional folylpolyglutamate synthase/dihydrofolate synthase n=1 Tax=Granulicella sp. WH15 TaxID=2602070 RepID=UPI00136742F9|nr:folylpolyglutamate synthase/dihydrofolate synthase family protein [Granulicella sp. WH15]QHN05240.1 bifunctional folylpolyglutamate synthase/dihydrofolate synthase [Granulicella sp. WH15]